MSAKRAAQQKIVEMVRPNARSFPTTATLAMGTQQIPEDFVGISAKSLKGLASPTGFEPVLTP
jgi:hypothetical protein